MRTGGRDEPCRPEEISESLGRYLLDCAPIGLGVVQDDRFVYLNDHAKRVIGHDPTELSAPSLRVLVPLPGRNGEGTAGEAGLEQDPFPPMERHVFPVWSRDGRWMITSAKTIEFNKKPASLVTIQGVDGPPAPGESLRVSCKRLAESNRHLLERFASVQESEALLKGMIVASPDIIAMTDLEGRIVIINQKGAEMAGYDDPAELTGRTVFSFFAPESLPLAVENTKRMFSGPLGPIEYTFLTRDGRRIPLEVNGDVLYTPAGVPFGMVYFCRDIRERKRVEESLRLANKKLTILSGITRHDINNRLLALNAYIEMLREEVPDRSLDYIFSQVRAASWQIGNMIQFTKEYEEIGAVSPAWQPVRALVDLAGESYSSAPVVLQNEIAPGLEVFADPLILRVFFNLIDNAVRHGTGTPTVRFSVEGRGGTEMIVCEDDGPGVPEDSKERIFEPGFGSNSGFGLTISREILGITGISIWEVGKAGHGARFEMIVPAGGLRQACG
ncbi:MAG TPA: PAS domain S-box protein [Methanoregulaceae archaeon]|nr:PAS domain S-box protein [Methanoregulaceae archaeon]